MTETAGMPPTAKGERTRGAIIGAAAQIMHERGAAATTLAQVRSAAGVSSSQLYHYFADKRELVHSVVDYQADILVEGQRAHDLSSVAGFRAWRDEVIASQRVDGAGGCPLGSLGADLAEVDAAGRARVALAFDRWEQAIETGVQSMQRAGRLGAELDVAELALGILSCLQGGLLLSQVQRSARPLTAALNTVVLLVESVAISD